MTDNDPATKKDLLDLETRLKESVAELVRDAQTEILRGFDHFQTGIVIRLRKAESDISNINASTALRLENLEERVFEIEKKLITGNR
jgi:hypothetical protein